MGKKGRSALTQMLEPPICASFGAIVRMVGADNKAAKETGLGTNWMDSDRRWSITLHGRMLVRGKANLEALEIKCISHLQSLCMMPQWS